MKALGAGPVGNTRAKLGGYGPTYPYDHPVADRYGSDILADNPHRTRRLRSTEQPVEIGLVVEDAQTGFVGAVVRVEYGRMDLEDRNGRTKPFPVGPGYLIEGKPVILTAPKKASVNAKATTASGSVALAGARAKVALASRIYVEGRHDAELVEQVWGEDLRIEGVVVEYLGGVDDLAAIVSDFAPGPGRRLGGAGRPLGRRVQGGPHRRDGSPGSRTGLHPGRGTSLHRHLASGQASANRGGGLADRPEGQDWKHGVCEGLAWKHRDQPEEPPKPQ